jgi:hypothetical protein
VFGILLNSGSLDLVFSRREIIKVFNNKGLQNIVRYLLCVTGRRGRRRRKLMDGLNERREYSHLKEEALDRTVWGTRFGRGFGPVVRQTLNV